MGQRRQSNLMNLQLRSFAMSYIPPFFIQFLCTSALLGTMFIRPAAAPCQHAIHDCQRQQGRLLDMFFYRQAWQAQTHLCPARWRLRGQSSLEQAGLQVLNTFVVEETHALSP